MIKELEESSGLKKYTVTVELNSTADADAVKKDISEALRDTIVKDGKDFYGGNYQVTNITVDSTSDNSIDEGTLPDGNTFNDKEGKEVAEKIMVALPELGLTNRYSVNSDYVPSIDVYKDSDRNWGVDTISDTGSSFDLSIGAYTNSDEGSDKFGIQVEFDINDVVDSIKVIYRLKKIADSMPSHNWEVLY
jgi:hypothetical protein